jgi:hypothetical protein
MAVVFCCTQDEKMKKDDSSAKFVILSEAKDLAGEKEIHYEQFYKQSEVVFHE